MDTFSTNKEYNLYKDIQMRTGGEIYIGVVGPVRTGKSTFIKRFMDLLVIPFMKESSEKLRAQDELPQSGSGKTITTTEPKFIPKEAAEVTLSGDVFVKVRLVDCVGFMVDGATGHLEEEQERKVKTPWYPEEIPFTKAAEIGTKKVITDHATIGVVITTDGSIGELKRNDYIDAEEKTIRELKALNKPFIVIVNSTKPYGEEANRVVEEISNLHHVTAISLNCEQMKQEDIHKVLENVLYEFPITMLEIYTKAWVEMLPRTNDLKAEIIEKTREYMEKIHSIKDVLLQGKTNIYNSEYLKNSRIDKIDLSNGCIQLILDVDDSFYYEMISKLMDTKISGEYDLIESIKKLSEMKCEYQKVLNAMEMVRYKGYGVVNPELAEIKLEPPEVIKHGNKYGVKIKATSPSLHMIRANVSTEIAPIVGSKEQADDLVQYIEESSQSSDGIWETNIFGKTVKQLIYDGIENKISKISDESQMNLQESMQKIVNDSSGGMIFIII
ncbi:MAG: stage IV sporulation protein A [Lachnospiraceae bacterium]